MCMIRTLFYLLAVCLFSACSTVNYIGIETYNPAEVTFPKAVNKVLVVNNAVPQPDNAGYQYSLLGVMQDTARAVADSALFDACNSLGKSIVDVSFFKDVLLYHENTRSDTRYLTDETLSADAVKELCAETGTQAILSFDRLLFEMDKSVVAFSEGYVIGNVNVKVSGVVRSYLPGRDKPLATVYVLDSLYWSEPADNMELLNVYLPKPNDALRAAGQFIGTKVTPNFVPHWDNETRWYYTGVGARWKEASAYATSDKWNEAAVRWKYLYEHSSSWKEGAKAASNLALYYEMETKLKEAFDWASKSYTLFEKNKGAEDKSTKMQKLYLDVLTERLRADKKLNMQFGEE